MSMDKEKNIIPTIEEVNEIIKNTKHVNIDVEEIERKAPADWQGTEVHGVADHPDYHNVLRAELHELENPGRL